MDFIDTATPSDLYDLICLVGTGSFGHVWKGISRTAVLKATQETIALEAGQTVALKIVPAVDKDTVFKLMQEISWLAKCSSPYITSFYTAHMKENDLWICMEYCNVGSLAKVLQYENAGLREPVIAAILYQIVCALEYLHKSLLLHRDIKCDNVLLNSSGAAKLADLGVAHQLQGSWDTCSVATGTPYWMAPELIAGKEYCFPVDVWSLGVTVIEMADTKPPLFEYLPQQALFLISKEDHRPLISNAAAYSPLLHDFVAKCCAHKPSDRLSAVQLGAHKFLSGMENRNGALEEFVAELDMGKNLKSMGSSENNSQSSSLWLTTDYGNAGGADLRTNDYETHCELFPLCEGCFYVPEDEPWCEDFTLDYNFDKSVLTQSSISEAEEPIPVPPAGKSIPNTVESLFQLMRHPTRGVPLGSRYHRFRRFKDVFLGADAVLWIQNQCLTDHNAAVVVAQELLRRQFIINVVDQSTLFRDSRNALYVFSQPLTRPGAPPDIAATAHIMVPSLLRLRARTFDNVGFLGRTYRDCFLGTDVIDLIMNEVRVDDRQNATDVARYLLSNGYFAPVLPCKRIEFEANNLYKSVL